MFKYLFGAFVASVTVILNAQIPDFTYEVLFEADKSMLCQESLADIDNDNDLDIILGSNAGTLWWYENIDGKNFAQHQIGDFALSDKGGITVDIDGDGYLDQVSGGTWYKNPGNKDGEWERYENGCIYPYDMQTADLDGDGTIEIISTSQQDGTYIYFPGSNPTKKWKSVYLGEGVPGGIAPKGIGDIDGDGDLDIVRSNIWFNNLDGNAKKWGEKKTLSFVHYQGKYALSSRVFITDMDGDGDLDVIQSEANSPNGSLAWHENKDGRGVNWFLHSISRETDQDLHSLCVADFDNDGDMDIFSGGGPMTHNLYKRCFIWENKDGEGVEWEQKEILFKQECMDAMAGDIDGDGDIDIIGKPWKGNTVWVLRNNLK